MNDKKLALSSEIVSKIEGIGPVFAKKLASAGISTLNDLRSMDAPGVHKKTGISRRRLETWRGMSVLQMIGGIDHQISEVFVKAGIDNLSKLISASPDFLLGEIKKARTPRWIINIIPDTYRRVIILSDIISWQNEAKRLVDAGGSARRSLVFRPWIISRPEWGAVPPTGSYTSHNPWRITIYHTAGSQSQSVKDIQKYHMEQRAYIDIGYHYVIDSRANIYEGRPVTVEGAHVVGQNSGNVGIAVIGNYDIADITETQHSRIVELGAWLCNAFAISVDKIKGHRDWDESNICPGRYLYACISRIKSEIYNVLNPSSPPPADPPPPSSNSGCFITTAAYGSSLAPEVQFFRSLRDNIIRKTRWGNDFFDDYWKHYYKISPRIADAMRSDPALKSAVTWSIVTPLLNYLKLVMTRPSFNVNNVKPASARTFLKNAKNDMDEWLSKIPPPESFEGMADKDIIDELGIVLNFVLRETKKQKKYLNKLVRAGDLPLRCGRDEVKVLSAGLKGYGVSSENIRRIISPQRHKKK